MLIRFVVYGVLGWCVEIVFTALTRLREPDRRWRLEGTTYLWMFPVYGLIAPLYEPVHDLVRAHPVLLRAAVYGAGILAVEYAAGWTLARATGQCPWDYSSRARWHLHGYARFDYAPLWMGLGVALEPVHDFLVRLTPAIRAALG